MCLSYSRTYVYIALAPAQFQFVHGQWDRLLTTIVKDCFNLFITLNRFWVIFSLLSMMHFFLNIVLFLVCGIKLNSVAVPVDNNNPRQVPPPTDGLEVDLRRMTRENKWNRVNLDTLPFDALKRKDLFESEKKGKVCAECMAWMMKLVRETGEGRNFRCLPMPERMDQ